MYDQREKENQENRACFPISGFLQCNSGHHALSLDSNRVAVCVSISADMM